MSESDDKLVEKARYDRSAQSLLFRANGLPGVYGVDSIDAVLQKPYRAYTVLLDNNLSTDSRVLEIGAGTGIFTGVLLETGARVISTDISEKSLEVIRKRYARHANLTTRLADMEALPFDDAAFNVVTSAGSLSYGDNQVVLKEIYRVLKPGGCFICVDSLNHNPVYALNRWIHFLRGARTKSTLQRMPLLSLIENYEKKFGSCKAKFFGSIVWASPILKIFGDRFASIFIDGFDKLFKIKKSAFKFVMCVKKVK